MSLSAISFIWTSPNPPGFSTDEWVGLCVRGVRSREEKQMMHRQRPYDLLTIVNDQRISLTLSILIISSS